MAIGFRTSVTQDFTDTAGSMIIPTAVQAGDGMLALVSWNNGSSTVDVSITSGWTQVGSDIVVTTRTSRLFKRIATSSDAGSTFTITTDSLSTTKFIGSIVVYAGTDLTNFVDAVQTSTDGSAGTSHSAPSATANVTGDWGVVMWAEKSTTSDPGWVPPSTPATIIQRVNDSGSGGGQLSHLICDSNAAVS